MPNSIPHIATATQDGVHYDSTLREFAVIVNGDVVAWGDTPALAQLAYEGITQPDESDVDPDDLVLWTTPSGTVVLEVPRC